MRRLALTTALVAILGLGFASQAEAADTPGVVDRSSGVWILQDKGGDLAPIGYGDPQDVPFMGDWDCDGVDTPGLYRRSDGFVYLRNSNTTGVADITFRFGIPNDLPIIGDFNGDGCDTVSIYRPSEARFYVINELGKNGGGLGFADYDFLFGNPEDVPFSGDWNGDGIDTMGLRRPSDGVVYMRNSNTTGVADISFLYGNPGDIPFSGDWDDDGDDSLGIYRPSTGLSYLRYTNSTGVADETACLGDSRGYPVAGTFGDLSSLPAPRVQLEAIGTGFSQPVLVTAPDGDCRQFVVELGGDIEVISGGLKNPLPFLDLNVTTGGERGLLGLAFHPDYAKNGKFYVNYSFGTTTRISEFEVSADPDLADASSERVLLQIPQPFANHNGGSLDFDESGYLLIALGDGGGGGDPGDRAENPFDLLGKILRIDVDGREGGRQYAIPADNPFKTGGGAPEVFLVGLRNPWRIDVDRGLLYIADVGQATAEEVTVIDDSSGGANLGWNTWEGTHCYDPPCSNAGFTFPTLEYRHPEGCSITGGHVYRGRLLDHLDGTYFYGDFCNGWIRSFVYSGGAATDEIDWTGTLGVVRVLSSFGVDGYGELYITSFSGGGVYKLSPRP